MKRCLILLTTCFPFTSGEPYLEAELPRLAARFSHIYIFTVGLEPNAAPTQMLPENVTAYNCARLSRTRGKITDFLRGLPTVLFLPRLPQADLREAGHSPAKRAFLGYFLSRVRRHTDEITAYLDRMGFSGFDEVCLYSYWFFVAAAVGARLRDVLRQKGVPTKCISRAHSYDLYTYANRLRYLPCRTMLLEKTDAVYICSADGHQYLSERYPEFAHKMHISYLGTEGGTLTAGSGDGVFRILTCSRTIPLKRLDRLCDALLLLQYSGDAIEWTHIGDGPALAALQSKAQSLHLAAPVRFTGALSHDNVLQYYRTHPVDLFVNLSSREGLPVAVMEALSFGVPAAVTNVGGCKELIRDGQNGYLLAADFSDEALAAVLQKAISAAASMREAAYDTWCRKFSAAHNYSQFIDAIEDGSANS